MAIKLNIPVLEDNPILIAETRPKKIEQSLTDIATKGMEELASYLHDELENLNRQKVSANARLQALECYRPFLTDAARTLARYYINSTLPLHDHAKSAAEMASSLWLELGYGYKLVLIDLQNQLIKLGTDKSSTLAIYGAIHAISEHTLLHYQTYVTPPPHIWSDLHQLYFCAVQLGVHNDDVDAPHTPALTTISNVYKHALLMSLCGSQQLNQHDIQSAYEYLMHYIELTSITAVKPLEKKSGIFVVSLNADKPPRPFSKHKIKPNPITDILLITIKLVSAIHQDLKDLQHSRLPENGSIPPTADRYDHIELLTHLIRNWGVAPKRIYHRALKNNNINLIVGLHAIHQFFSGTTDAADKQITAPNADEPPRSHWQTLNVSPNGMAIRRLHTTERNISIGALLAIKEANEAHWSIGLVRWANCGAMDRLNIGVQLIAPQAQSASTHLEQAVHNLPLLLLPEIATTKQEATLVAPRGTYKPLLQLTVSCNGKTLQVLLTKLMEYTQTVERMQYTILSE